jgi:hypothetical protein
MKKSTQLPSRLNVNKFNVIIVIKQLNMITLRRRNFLINWYLIRWSRNPRCSSAKFSGHVSHPCFICFAIKCLLALLTDVSVGRIKMTRTRLIVGLITSHHTYLTITKTRKGRPRPDPGCSATDDDDDDDGQEISALYRARKLIRVITRSQYRGTPMSFMRQMNPLHIFTSCLFNIHISSHYAIVFILLARFVSHSPVFNKP